MTTHTALPKIPSIQSDDEDDGKHDSTLSPPNSKLLVEPDETRVITIAEAVGLDFNSFIPQADITSQVHFISNIQADSKAGLAGLKDGDRILQINGINVTNLEHEDVRKLVQLMTPIILTVANDPKYLLLLQQPVEDIEEKPPELPITLNQETEADPTNRLLNRFELKQHSSVDSVESVVSTTQSSTKSPRYEIFNLTHPDESSNEEPLKAKLCRLRRSKTYNGYGLTLKFQQHLHVIGQVEEASPSYKAGVRENDVIIFVGKTNVEKLSHEDVKVMIRGMTLGSHHVQLVVLSKLDIPKYKTLQEKGFIDWSIVGLEK